MLEDTVKYIRENYPDQFVIADAKRGDIGNTAAMYARSFYEAMDFDAVTLAPYMGADSVRPFLEYKDKWAVILALTSNKSATDFETVADENGHSRPREDGSCLASVSSSRRKIFEVFGRKIVYIH